MSRLKIVDKCLHDQRPHTMLSSLASFEDQFAGKFCAALDRQHPRDLFDVKLFFENFTFTEKLKKPFFVYLISGNRHIHEMIRPNLLDQRKLCIEQFQGMASAESTYEELEAARAQLDTNH